EGLSMNTKLKLAAAASTAALLIVGFGGAGAQAAKWITGADVKNGSLTGADIKNRSLTGADIKDGSLSAKKLSKGVQQRLADVKTLKDGVDGKNFELTEAKTFAPKTIDNIGGSFTARATVIGTFELPAGKFLVQT